MYSIRKIRQRAKKYLKADPSLKNDPDRLKDILHNEFGAIGSSKMLDTIIVIVVGLYAVAYVLPTAMEALGNISTTYWPTGSGELIAPIGIFVMIGLLVLFAKGGAQKD